MKFNYYLVKIRLMPYSPADLTLLLVTPEQVSRSSRQPIIERRAVPPRLSNANDREVSEGIYRGPKRDSCDRENRPSNDDGCHQTRASGRAIVADIAPCIRVGHESLPRSE
jgi:hypothetical protein